MQTLKQGDRVRRKDGELFSNNERVNTVSHPTPNGVWMKETNSWIDYESIEQVFEFKWFLDPKNIPMPPITIRETEHQVSVYLDDGRVFEYRVASAASGREHASAIIKTGYRSTPENTNDLEWYPPHRILKVKVAGAAESTNYRDKVRAT